MLLDALLAVRRRWTDPHQQFALHLLLPAN
jgi:hypothetical protein